MHGLQNAGSEVIYLTADDLGSSGVRLLRDWHRLINRLIGWLFPHTDFWSLSWGLLERFNMGRLAAKVAAARACSHVHCHDPFIAAAYHFFSRWWWRGKRRWGITQHGFGCFTQAFHEDGALLGPGMMRALRRWERRILARADWVLIPTRAGAEQLARDLAQYPPPAHWWVIPHPVPQVIPLTREQARKRLGWHEERCHIIAVGRFAPLKRLPDLVRACADLAQLDWQLVLVGDGDREALQELALSLGIGERIAFAVSDEMGLYYAAADIYVSVSITESFGLANLEAISHELPALCTAAGGTPEVVGTGAWLIPPANPVALTSALQALIEDRWLRAFWSDRARFWTAAWPNAADVASAYLALYRGETQSDTPLRMWPVVAPAPFAAWHVQVANWAVCPLPPQLDPTPGGRALVLAPHSDDETLGCGGTLARLRQAGWQVKVVVVTDGAKGDPEGFLGQEDIAGVRQGETRAALAALGLEDVQFLGQPEGESYAWDLISAEVDRILESFAPEWLLVPAALDLHRDHVQTSLLALELWQSRGCRERLFFYELWQPLPINRVVDVTPVLAQKRRAIAAYALPLRYLDYAAAFDGLMRYRGIYLASQSGTHAEGLLELDASSWRAVLADLMRLRARQEPAESALPSSPKTAAPV